VSVATPEQLRAQLDRYCRFLEQDPSNPNLHAELAELHLRLGEFAQARKILQQAASRWPAHAGLKSRLASVAIAESKPDEAIALLQAVRRDGDDHPIVRYNLGFAMMSAGRFAEAKDLLAGTPDDARDAPHTPLLLARVLHHLGEIDEAVRRAKAYVARHPQDAEALGVLAVLSLDSDDHAAAEDYAEKALRLNPADHGALVTLGSLALGRRDPAKAAGYFDRALERDARSGRAWSGRGLSAMLGLDLDRALEYFRRAVEHMPDHIGTWHALAWCQIMKSDLEGAKASLEQAMALDRNFGETHGGLAVIAVMQNRLEEAPDLIKRALRLDPSSFAGRFAQSLLTSKSDPAKAQQMIQNILLSSAGPGGEPLRDVLTRVTLKRSGR
jgi:tetratricopeptide (TPR) repeat protein